MTAGSVSGSAAALRAMRDAGCELLVHDSPSPFDQDWLLTQVRDVDGLIVAMEPLTRRVFDAAPRLRVIARPGVSHDTVDVAAATQRGIAVTIAAGANDQSVADFTIGLLLRAPAGSQMPPEACSATAGSVRSGRKSGARRSRWSALAASA